MGKTLGYGEITVANMTEPFTVMLTNEAQQFATDSNRKVTSTQSYYTDIIVIRGSQERTDYTIGNITSGSGITVSKNSKRVTFSVSAGTTIGADAGVIEIPITLDGQTVKKQFSWSCGKQGPQGVKGNDGNSFAWNMLSETNCGKKHWGTESSGGKYSVEDFITEDNIDAVKLICTEAISTSNWSYVSFKDIKMLKQLKPSTKYTLSYDIKANRSGAISHSICKGDVSNFCTNTVVVNNIIGNETWQHISVVLTTNDLKTTPTNEILYLGRNALSKVGYSIIKNLKLVEGDIDTPWSPSQSDIEGKGVVETVQYYLATSQASGVTSSTSGWSTDITTQKLTADKKYLWNCYQTKYSDGTSEPISTPKVIGVYGDKGTSTKIIRTGYKYTQNNIDTFSASGYSSTWGTADATTGLKVGDNVLLRVKNTTKGSDCLIFASITAIPSNYSLTCTSYGLIDNGADGQDGEDGAGFHWNLLKYSGDLSKQVLGGAGTYTATVESIEDKTTPSGQAEKITYTVQGTGGKFIQTGKYIKEGDIKQGKTYTVSVWCKCSSIKSTGVINAEFLDNKTYVNPTLSTEWQQYVVTGVANKDVTSTSSASAISFYYSDNMSVGDIFYISSPKVEEGDKASPWCTTYEETLAKNLSITPSSQYFKSTDGGKTFAPNTITIKPTIQGEISFGKWQYSIDGGVSFADVVSGQKGLTISNNVLAVSKDSSLYSDAVTMVTFRAVANDSSFYDTCSIAKIYDVSDIGDGRNLWITRDNITLQACEKDKYIYTTTGTSTVCIGADGSSVGTNTIALQTGTKYTISFVISSPSEVGNARWYFCTALNSTGVKNYGGYGVKLVTGENIVSQTITVDTSCDAAGLVLYHLPTGCVIKDIQVEKGSSPTGWTPAPEDLQTAILSTKSEISDVSSQVDNNKQAIEQRVEKTTYQQDLKLVKGDISKANEGLNKWRYEIYPKSLFASEYQGKSTMDVFAKNTNLTPSQSVLINDTDFGKSWAYGDNYIGYALTFVKFSTAKSVAITFKHDDGAHLYLNGKLVGGDDTCNTGSGQSLTLSFVQGWNCLEVVLNEKSGGEYIGFGTTVSTISECQLMNCYYGTPVARQSHITNQLVENTTNIEGVTTTMQKVMTTVGGSDRIDEFVNNYNKTIESEKQFKKTIGETYTTKDEFNGLEIGGRNLLTKDDCNMSKWQNLYPVHCKVTNNDYSNHIDYVPTSGEWEIIYKKISVTKGQKYILSFDYKVNKAYNYLSGQKYGVYLSTSVPTNAAPANIITNGQYVIENTVTSLKRGVITFTAPIDTLYIVINGGCIDDNQTGLSFEFNKWKLEKGNKITDWTPAPEDNEINGQNLVSNLPSNWEQGSFVVEDDSKNKTYSEVKVSEKTQIRIKELIPVFGDITISAQAIQNSSKESLNHYVILFDVNKRYMGKHNVNGWNTSFPRMFNCGDAKYIAIALKWGDGTKTQITPSDISQICLKIERGTSATPFTLAPEDVNGKIVNVETIANQTAKKFEWIVKGGDSSSNFTLTDRVADLVAERINFKGLVKFSGLSTDAKSDILNSFEVGGINLISDTRDMKSWAKGGKLTITYDQLDIKNNTNAIKVVNSKSTAGNAYLEPPNRGPLSSGKYTVSFYAKTDSTSGADVSVLITDEYTKTFKINNIWTQYIITFDVANDIPVTNNFFWFNFFGTTEPIYFCYVKLEKGNKPTDWSPNPEDYLPQANLVSNWTTNSTWIDGGKIYTGSITADKIATDAIKSRNYISSGGTQGSFLNLSDGSFQSPNLSWDSNGNLIAKNANLSGQITATKGSIGGWSVDNYSIYTTYDADQNIFGSGISGTKGKYVLWAGETNNAIGANRSSDTPTDASLVIYNNGGLEVRKTMVGNDKKNHLYTTILQSGQINLKMDDNYIGTITATDTISSNSTVTMSHVSMAAKKGYGWSILHTDDSGNLISDIQRDPSDTKIKINSPITVSSTDISKYNAIETTGDVVVSGKIHANYGSNKIQLNPDNNGSIELYGYTPFIDFHYGNSDSDYTSRIIAQEWGLQIVGTATVTGDLYCDAHIYTCTNGHFSWAGQTDAYLGCGNYSGGNNIYYYANYHAFYVNNDSGSGMMYINTNGVTSRVGFTKTSDERIKKNFESFDDNIIDAYMNIEPVKYQLKQSSNDNYHFGFKAQHVDKVFSDYGDTYNESFDICTSRPIDPDKAKELYGVDGMVEEYGLRYDELIAPTTYMVQHTYKELESTKDELTKVKQEKADLETRLQAIEAKLGL